MEQANGGARQFDSDHCLYPGAHTFDRKDFSPLCYSIQLAAGCSWDVLARDIRFAHRILRCFDDRQKARDKSSSLFPMN